MSLYAVLSDIHGNYEALKAVVRDAKRQAKKTGALPLKFVCLGDVVDYGPQPNECMNWVLKNVSPAFFVRGNHDQDVVASFHEPPQTIKEDYWPITLWTRRTLKPKYHQALQSDFKNSHRQSPSNEFSDFTLFHGSLFSVEDKINAEGTAQRNIDRLRTLYGLFGHTHYQGCFYEDLRFEHGRHQRHFMYLTHPEGYRKRTTPLFSPLTWTPIKLNEWRKFPEFSKVLLNPGSVGQPRRHAVQKDAFQPVDHDNRAAYMLLSANGDGRWQFQFRRVTYDVAKTVQLLETLAYPTEAVTEGGAIDLNRVERERVDPGYKKLREIEANIHTLLPELVATTLIPTLVEGH